MLVLGIESTCDETAVAVVKDGKEILSNLVSSQIDLHQQFGGVVPELACRRHVEVFLPLIKEAIQQAKVSLDEINLIAVAHGPGLIGALLIGLNAAKALGLALNKPFIGVNHIEAHLYAAIMCQKEPVSFPALGVILSGGHTSLVHIEAIGKYATISQTVDDAIGEAFDKVAKLLGLPYPGGPVIESLAKKGDPHTFPLKPGKVKTHPLHFSFSGLKTAVLYALKGQNAESAIVLTEKIKCDMAASFQRAAFQDILEKTKAAAKSKNLTRILFGGGVTNSLTLRKLFAEEAAEFDQFFPTQDLSLDNAAMIAGLGYHTYQRKGSGDSLDLDPLTRISF